jgi:hypothetical protein
MCEELEQRVRQANNILVLKQSTLRPLLELCRKELLYLQLCRREVCIHCD